MNHTLSGGLLISALAVFAVLQLLTQLIFFLHLGDERKPRLQGMALVFMVLVVGIVVIGSLWIMEHLNYHMDNNPEVIKQQLDESDDL